MEETREQKDRLEQFNILACDEVLSKVEPYQLFNLNIVLQNFDYSKYRDIGKIASIQYTDIIHDDITFSVVREWMTNKGYIERSKVSERERPEYFICELTDKGRRVQRLKGHKKYLENEEKKDNAIFIGLGLQKIAIVISVFVLVVLIITQVTTCNHQQREEMRYSVDTTKTIINEKK